MIPPKRGPMSEIPQSYFLKTTDNGIEVDSGVEFGFIKDYFKMDLRGKNSESISRWIVHDIARIPETNERFGIDGLVDE